MHKIENPKTVECPTLSPDRQMLWDAANLIEERGHAKGALVRVDGSMCALGALNCAATGDPLDHQQRHDVSGFMVAFSSLTKRVGGDIVEWNNAPERTKEEVVSELRSAALS